MSLSLRKSPRGYRDFALVLGDEGFEDYRLEVVRHNVGITAADLKLGFLEGGFDTLSFFPDLNEALAHCPLHLIQDQERLALPPLAPQLIQCIPHIEETKQFKRMYRKLDPRYQRDWEKAKESFAIETPRHPKFKKLKGSLRDCFGIYLSDGFRAHIRRTKRNTWEAVEIGSHKELGHE